MGFGCIAAKAKLAIALFHFLLWLLLFTERLRCGEGGPFRSLSSREDEKKKHTGQKWRCACKRHTISSVCSGNAVCFFFLFIARYQMRANGEYAGEHEYMRQLLQLAFGGSCNIMWKWFECNVFLLFFLFISAVLWCNGQMRMLGTWNCASDEWETGSRYEEMWFLLLFISFSHSFSDCDWCCMLLSCCFISFRFVN